MKVRFTEDCCPEQILASDFYRKGGIVDLPVEVDAVKRIEKHLNDLCGGGGEHSEGYRSALIYVLRILKESL